MRLTAPRIAILVVGFATVATLVVSATLLHVPPANTHPSEVKVQSLAKRFFDAANEYRTHDSPDPFIGVITEEFSLHVHNRHTTLGRQDFLELLSGWNAAYPAMQFVQQEITSEDSLAIVQYELTGTTGEVAGLPFAPMRAPSVHIALLRIEKGKVAEVWGLPELGSIQKLVDVAVENVGGRKLVGIARATYAAGASAPREVVPGALLIILLHGEIDVRVDGTFESVSADGSVMRAVAATGTSSVKQVVPGEILMIPAFTWHQLSNGGTTPATLLIAAVFTATSATWSTSGKLPAISSNTPPWPVSRSDGVVVQPLIGGTANAPKLDEVIVQIDRFTLGPGHGLETHGQTGTLLLLIEQGSVDYEIAGPNSAVVNGASGDTESIPFTANLRVDEGLMVTNEEPGHQAEPESESSGTISIFNAGGDTAVVFALTVLHSEIA